MRKLRKWRKSMRRTAKKLHSLSYQPTLPNWGKLWRQSQWSNWLHLSTQTAHLALLIRKRDTVRMSEIKLFSKERPPLFSRHKPVSWFKRMIKLSRVCLASMGASRATKGLGMEWIPGSVLTNNMQTRRIQTIPAMASSSTQKNMQRPSSSNAMPWSRLTFVVNQCCAKAPASPNYATSIQATKVPSPRPSMARRTTWHRCHHQAHRDAQQLTTKTNNLEMSSTLTSLH